MCQVCSGHGGHSSEWDRCLANKVMDVDPRAGDDGVELGQAASGKKEEEAFLKGVLREGISEAGLCQMR